MIFKSAIKEFLNRSLDDWSFTKNMPTEVLMKEIHDLVPEMTFKTVPRQAQAACVYIGIYVDCFNLWLKMGIGKSKAVLDMVRLKQLMNGDLQKIFLVCLSEVSCETWREQIELHSDYTSIGLFGETSQRLELLKEDRDIYIINYAGLLRLFSRDRKIKEGVKSRIKTKQEPDPKAIAKFVKNFNCIILDELPLRSSDKGSLTFRVLKKMGNDIKYRYNLTGTPFGRDPVKLWSPYYIIDHGETLGHSLEVFRSAFFSNKALHFGGVEYTFKKNLEDKLHATLKHRSIRYTLEEVKDVLPVSRIIRPVSWPHENLIYYNRALDGLTEELKHATDFGSIENSFMKLRQIAAGFLGFKNDVGDRLQIKFDHNPRLDMLYEILEEIPDEKTIIFYEYTPSGDFIEELLKKHKIDYVRLYGGTKDKIGALRSFLHNKSKRIFLIQSQSGGVSLNLQIAKYGIFYESSVDCVIREQCEARYTGARQEHPHAFMYDIVMMNSVDYDILQFHKEGKDITQAIIEGKCSLGRKRTRPRVRRLS